MTERDLIDESIGFDGDEAEPEMAEPGRKTRKKTNAPQKKKYKWRQRDDATRQTPPQKKSTKETTPKGNETETTNDGKQKERNIPTAPKYRRRTKRKTHTTRKKLFTWKPPLQNGEGGNAKKHPLFPCRET